MKITRYGSVVWTGAMKDGRGAISTESGALHDYPYGFASRFEGQRGSNPEELVGAAHASCFSMALSMILTEAKLTPESISTRSDVTLESVEGGYAITTVHLTVQGRVPGADAETFAKLAGIAKVNCPVSKLLRADVTMSAELLS